MLIGKLSRGARAGLWSVIAAVTSVCGIQESLTGTRWLGILVG